MPLIPAFLTTPCPWCGHHILAPVATPIRELDALLEERCRSCTGGVRARSSWEAFACFALAYGLVSDATLALAYEGYFHVRDVIGVGSIAVWSIAFITVALVAWRFLITNSAVRRGAEPKPR